ncbi:ComF family protein [bacterium AH-315-J21]|nr:ComF family protein [bacterium AH-315-J21]
MLQKFKYDGFLSLGERLALALVRLRARQIRALKADILVPIPLHITGFKARGFNQALVISDILSRVTGLPVAINMVEKIVKTKNQANLSTERRQSNLAGAFIADCSEVSGKRVIIVDDVITTGSTIAEVGMTIEQTGIKVVGAVALASAIDYCTLTRPAQ